MVKIEEALLYELEKIVEFKKQIYPTNIPKKAEPPYLTYILNDCVKTRTLTEVLECTDSKYLINVMCKSYLQMKELTRKVENLLYGFIGKEIGLVPVYIENVIVRRSEVYENEVELYRGIIDVELQY